MTQKYKLCCTNMYRKKGFMTIYLAVWPTSIIAASGVRGPSISKGAVHTQASDLCCCLITNWQLVRIQALIISVFICMFVCTWVFSRYTGFLPHIGD